MIEPVRPEDHLSLADWRRQVADLYAEVRRRGGSNPEDAWDYWKSTRGRLYTEHPQSPVPSPARAGFSNRYWPYDPALRFEVRVHGDDRLNTGPAAPVQLLVSAVKPATVAPLTSADLLMSTGDALSFARIGFVEIPFDTGIRQLSLFWMAGYAGGLFLPFRDATNGETTYGAGRYLLDTAKAADLGRGSTGDGLILDFNFAFHPSCAFDPKWACPLAPPENRLDI
ncbi:MAG: DUF1684 domain-containing protein, partial [Chloroflexota bacterium]